MFLPWLLAYKSRTDSPEGRKVNGERNTPTHPDEQNFQGKTEILGEFRYVKLTIVAPIASDPLAGASS